MHLPHTLLRSHNRLAPDRQERTGEHKHKAANARGLFERPLAFMPVTVAPPAFTRRLNRRAQVSEAPSEDVRTISLILWSTRTRYACRRAHSSHRKWSRLPEVAFCLPLEVSRQLPRSQRPDLFGSTPTAIEIMKRMGGTSTVITCSGIVPLLRTAPAHTFSQSPEKCRDEQMPRGKHGICPERLPRDADANV
jgi:hypothetical protein